MRPPLRQSSMYYCCVDRWRIVLTGNFWDDARWHCEIGLVPAYRLDFCPSCNYLSTVRFWFTQEIARRYIPRRCCFFASSTTLGKLSFVHYNDRHETNISLSVHFATSRYFIQFYIEITYTKTYCAFLFYIISERFISTKRMLILHTRARVLFNSWIFFQYFA